MENNPSRVKRPATPPGISSPLSSYPTGSPNQRSKKRRLNNRIQTDNVHMDEGFAQSAPFQVCSQSHTFRVRPNGTLKIVKHRRPMDHRPDDARFADVVEEFEEDDDEEDDQDDDEDDQEDEDDEEAEAEAEEDDEEENDDKHEDNEDELNNEFEDEDYQSAEFDENHEDEDVEHEEEDEDAEYVLDEDYYQNQGYEDEKEYEYVDNHLSKGFFGMLMLIY
ncbi:hypothetical protein O181_041524 [Austropuccinia psidii MF-1]|uniref:Uncharacterized protein n=1 Tax=Austropuccinia psidii MF-1 TaxID=1389203 RepID=A0A9Q3DEK8_9BASI|nr:hypothetical protein [Austropuccinia psidii MF-1]